ncbi:hypothetical protein BDFB_011710 [Asbolus verrucosus]|uniref:Uncharacterized protein n=1 Tax=Asbolus verrucosus TaxID=1661398 RepID=A0A482VZ16_ASBVE|nr:hypothetical protein BDFB_011710 [Asbolus verrucosus]
MSGYPNTACKLS